MCGSMPQQRCHRGANGQNACMSCVVIEPSASKPLPATSLPHAHKLRVCSHRFRRAFRMYTFAYSALLNPHEAKWGVYHELVRHRGEPVVEWPLRP